MAKPQVVPEGVTEALRALESLKSDLDAVDDGISAAIQELEQKFRSLGLGVRIAVVINEKPLLNYTIEVLAFDKLAGTWRFVVERGDDDTDPDFWEATPLLDCHRDLRAEALERHIPNLILSAVQQVKDKIGSRTGTLQVTRRLLAALEGRDA